MSRSSREQSGKHVVLFEIVSLIHYFIDHLRLPNNAFWSEADVYFESATDLNAQI